jgi:hypothetical protein
VPKVRCPIWTAQLSQASPYSTFPWPLAWLLGTGQDPEGRMASVLLCVVPKDQIFDAPLSLRGPASSYRPSAEVSWIALVVL